MHSVLYFYLRFCSHVKPVNNMVCVDSCFPACNNCHENAECVASYPNIPADFSPVYGCQCKNGYVGNGTVCTAKNCEYGNCPAKWGSFDCSGDNLCKCTESFTPKPFGFGNNDLCNCPEGSQIFYHESKPICVPLGRCIDEQWQCNVQKYNQVKCSSFGNNTFSTFKHCLCNYGFTGGWEYPCACAAGNRIVWSDAHHGEICLPPTGCTTNWHCSGSKQQCVIPSGQLVGTCVASELK